MPSPLTEEPLDRGLEWLVGHRDSFSIGWGPLAHDGRRLDVLKPFSEYALALCYLRQQEVLAEPIARRCDAELDWIWSEIGQGNLLADILIARSDLSPVLGLYAWMKERGYVSSRLDYLATYLSTSGLVDALPLLPWSRLSLCWALQQIGVEVSERTWETCRMAGWIAQQGQPWTFSDSIGYAVTHEVFYLTDWGRSPSSRLTTADQLYLRTWLPAWTSEAVHNEDWDLTAELLLAAEYINEPSLVAAHLSQLLEAQQPDGGFPGPRRVQVSISDRPGSHADRSFMTTYHTTLAACLLLGTLRPSGRDRAARDKQVTPEQAGPSR